MCICGRESLSLSFVRPFQCLCTMHVSLAVSVPVSMRAVRRASYRSAVSVEWECGPGTECDSRQDRLRGAS